MQDYSPYTCDPIDTCNSIKIQRVQPNLYLGMNQANIACSRTALCLSRQSLHLQLSKLVIKLANGYNKIVVVNSSLLRVGGHSPARAYRCPTTYGTRRL